MLKYNPSAWLKWAPAIVGLTALAGGVISTPSLRNDLKSLVDKAAPDLKVELDGRDATVSGEATAQADIDAAVKAVADTYGVRRVESKVVVVPPVKLANPTFTSLLINQSQPQLTGTWPEGAATTLAVTVAGKTYTLGRDADLTSAGGNWTLKPQAPIADGTYDVSIEITDGKKAKELATVSGGLTIDTVAPAAASINEPAADAVWPHIITGTWPVTEAKGLALSLGGKTFALGTDTELSSDKDGNFKLDSRQQLAPGSYDLKIDVSDAAGNLTTRTMAAAVVITAPKAPEPAPPPPPATKPAPATISPLTATENPVVVSGTWDSSLTKDVRVAVAGKSWDLQSGLTANANGTWTLQLPTLPDGTYDVAVTVTGNDGSVVNDTTKDELVIDTAPPTRPTINAVDTNEAVTSITGTFGHADTATLTVAIPAAKFVADSNAIKTDGDKWTVALPAALPPGFYDVVVTATDSIGRTTIDNSSNEITVAGPPAKLPLPKLEVSKAEPPKTQQPKTEQPKIEPPKTEPPKPKSVPALVAPTVDRMKSDKPTTAITGTWKPNAGDHLSVAVAGTTYELGVAPYNLLSGTEGKWRLNLEKELKNGVYDVVATALSSDGQKAMDATVGELEIAVPPPPAPPKSEPVPAPVVLAAPTVESLTSDQAKPLITGTWPAGVARTLVVTVAGETYRLGAAPYKLLATTNGKWKLEIGKDLPNGTYDVGVTVTDGAAQSVSDVTSNELVVNVPPPPAAKPAAKPSPYDCNQVLDKISAVFPIRFEFARTKLVSPYDSTINQYVALLKDPRCAGLHVTIEGHADYIGPVSFNQFLSDLRAEKTRDVLVAAGVDPSHLATKGMSEMEPLDPAKTPQARAMNRRVQFRAQ